MFRGSFPHSIDDKGRAAVPGKWRALLQGRDDDRLVLTRFVLEGARCLDVYPFREWVRFEDALQQQRRFDQRVIRFENYYLASAHDCSVDKQGRILIPPPLREYAGIAKDIVFAGALQKFRIWSAEAWARVERAAEQAMGEDPEFFTGLNI
jgi:MraZ protein